MLKEGVGTLGDLTFTDNSSWLRSRKFRLGLKVASGYCEGIRIREAKTEAFTVKDRRGELYKKHYPPALNDEVWRLEMIRKDGSFHKRLNSAGIFTVKDFLQLVVKDSQKLRTILGSGMSNKMWEALVEHAKTCVLCGKLYIYYSDDSRNVGVVFNDIYELSGLTANEQYYPADSLSDSQKVYVDTLVKKACDNWNQIVEYDEKSLLNFKQIEKSNTSHDDLHVGPVSYPIALNNQLPLQRLPVTVPCDQSSMDPNVLTGGSVYSNMITRYSTQFQLMNSSSRSQFDTTSFTQPDQQVNLSYDNRIGDALGPPLSPSFEAGISSIQQANLIPYEDWSHNWVKGVDDSLPEMLENDDMQHLIWPSSMGCHDNMITRYSNQSQLMNSSSHTQFDTTSFTQPDQQVNLSYDDRIGVALGPPLSSSFQAGNSSIQQANLNPFEDCSCNRVEGVDEEGVDDFLSDEENYIRSHEMLEEEDMQMLLSHFGMGGLSSINEMGRPKIKAEMRWVVRKKAAEKRA
ncbi:calmodulin-binding 60 B-like [Olea europaea subsp. europaea]|uniref:Calmodulin-binding 60 B-like n=1 Tax=Olea europaea subsp. europaea TaxID=158383 RepID=A0A8S0PC94_OLEEU|nr:calmodulin-binding 60 B-like [Olea europaea subsp. europaea]